MREMFYKRFINHLINVVVSHLYVTADLDNKDLVWRTWRDLLSAPAVHSLQSHPDLSAIRRCEHESY